MKILDLTKMIPVGDDVYRYRDEKGYCYYKKVECANCKAVLYRRRVDCKPGRLNFCQDKSCEAEYNKKNKLNKTYPAGYTEQLSDGRIRYYTGRTWSYRTSYNCANCGRAIIKEQSKYINNRFCDDKCKYEYSDPRGSKILNFKGNNSFYYLLGLIATDGTVSYPLNDSNKHRRYSVCISLKNTDSEVLYRIQEMFGGHTSPKNNSNMVNWIISNQQFVEYLKFIGITRKKSLTLNIDNFFNSLTEPQRSAFIRGVIDGDGYVGIDEEDQITVGMCSGSISFIKTISTYMNSIIGIDKSPLTAHPEESNKWSKNPIHSITYTSGQSKKILHHLYSYFNVGDLYIKRKYDAYRALGELQEKRFLYSAPDEILRYTYSDLAQQLEFNSITSTIGAYSRKPTNNRIILSHQPHFYEVENKLWKNPIIREKLLQNREKYLKKSRIELTQREILRGFKISGIHIGYSHFSPFWIKYFITDNNIQSVYDFCGGWGHRLLGCHNIKYIYNDQNTQSYEGCIKIAKKFNLDQSIFYNNDSSKFTPPDNYEAIFTCPPYYNIESYGKPFDTLEEYVQWWRDSLLHAIKPGVHTVAYVINHTYLEITKNICTSLNLNHKEDIDLYTASSHFNRVRRSNKREVLVHFKV